jgi:glycosyltransferase involved in cell wall biosynthesis
VDNDADPAIDELLAATGVPYRHHLLPGNPGCAAALAHGLRHALADPSADAFLILDDDAELSAECVQELEMELSRGEVNVAVPVIVDERGEITSIAGLLDPIAWRQIKQPSLEQYQKECGLKPVKFSWCPGVCLLVSRQAVVKLGVPREDLWMMGEDLEYSMRLTADGGGAFVPRARAKHLPPTPAFPIAGRKREYVKRLAMLLNSMYLSTRVPHCRRLLWHLPGNCWKFLMHARWRPSAVFDLLAMLWTGAVRGENAGGRIFTTFRQS